MVGGASVGNAVDVMGYLVGAPEEERAAMLAAYPEAADIVFQQAQQELSEASPLGLAQVINPGHRDLPHLDYLDARLLRAVKNVEAGKSQFLRISMPPRSGKSVTTSEYLPLWLLARHPEWRVGLISHAPALAAGWGRAVRRMIDENGVLLNLAVARDAGSVTDWETTKRGGVSSRSVGQSITGRGFKCFHGDTLVESERGPLRIVDAYEHGIERILAYDHQSQRAVWRRVEAAIRSRRCEMVEVATTSGRSLVVTADHLIYVRGGYRPAANLRPGDPMVAVTMPHALPVWAGILDRRSDRPQSGGAGTEPLPLPGVRTCRASSDPVPALLPNVQDTSAGENPLLLGILQKLHLSANPADYRVSEVRRGVLPPLFSTAPLLTNLRESSALRTDAGTKELPALPGIVSQRQLPVDAAHSNGTGRMDVCRMPLDGTSGGTSPRRKPSEQYSDEPGDALSAVPHPTPQIERDTVASVTRLTGDEWVYDLQVEHDHNLFANGLLAHNCMIVDDLVKDYSDAASETRRQHLRDWWQTTARTRLEPPGLVIVIGTRWQEDDFTGWVDSAGDPFETIIFEAIATENDDLGRQPGDPLYSPFVTETRDEALARWRQIEIAVGPYAWSALYQQDPQPAGGSVFKRDWFHYWTRDPNLVSDHTVLLVPERTPGLTWIDSWDVAIEETETADYTVGQRWARDLEGRMFLIGQSREQTQFPDTLETFRQWAKPDSLLGTGRNVYRRVVERAANGYAVINTLEREIPGVEGINPKGSKEVRANAVTPEVAAGMVHLPHPSEPGNEWVHKYLDELARFPNARHDDQVDATTQALLTLRIGVGATRITNPSDRSGGLPSTASRTVAAARTGVRRSAAG